jgi:hypothetical protein
MSKKSELIQLFKEFKDRYSTIQARIAEVQKSDAYGYRKGTDYRQDTGRI